MKGLNNTTDSCNNDPDTTEEQVVKIIGYCIIIFFSIIGNSLVMAVILKNRGMKTNTNRFIVNMCLSDLLVTICVLPIKVMFIFSNEEWLIPGDFGRFICKLVPFVQDTSMGVSIFSMTVIAFDRYLAIAYPYKFHNFINTRRCYIIIATIWIISAGIHCHYLVNMNVYELEVRKCRQVWSENPEENIQIQMIFFPLAFALLYVIPLISIAFFYTCVVFELYCRSNAIEQSVEQRRARNKENREVAIMLISVVVFFAASWAPFNTLIFLDMFKWRIDSSYPCNFLDFKFVAEMLGHSNAAQNAFIYFTFNKRFKNGLKKLFGSKCELGDLNPTPEFTNGTSTAAKNHRLNAKNILTARKDGERMRLNTEV